MKVLQVGANKAGDELSEYLLSNYDELEFGLFVDANELHIQDIKDCYKKYSNVIVENVAIKPPTDNRDILTIYYHTNEHPYYGMASCNIEHIKKHMTWCPHLQGGEIKSFDVSCITLENLFEKYSIENLDWIYLDVEGIDSELLLTFDWKKYNIKRIEFEQLHLGAYRESIKDMMSGMGYKQVDALHEYDWAFEKDICTSFDRTINKLKNFPSINYISIKESIDRRDSLHEKFDRYNLSKITPHIFDRYDDSKFDIVGSNIHTLQGVGRGPVTSHLMAIKEWYFSTDEDYAIFCEDDLSFETVQYWNFTWEEFFNKLPSDWGCVQLSWVREDMFYFSENGLKLRPRCWCDWSACAYLMSRNHAKKLISNYYKNGTFTLDYVGNDKDKRYEWFLKPNAETIIFSDLSKVCGFPLFVEDIGNFPSTLHPNGNGCWNIYSHNTIMDWWKTKGVNKGVDELFSYGE